MLRTILVPLDGSPFSEQALPQAMSLAAAKNARVVLARVANPIVVGAEVAAPVFLDSETLEAAADYLESVKQQQDEALRERIDCAPLEGPIVEAVGNYVREHQVDMIVMTTHGRGPFVRMLIGSVADELLRTLTIPILTIRPSKDKPAAQPSHFQRVLIAIDGSARSTAVIPFALEMLDKKTTRLLLVRVLETLPIAAVEMGGQVVAPPLDLMDDVRGAATHWLKDTAASLSQLGWEVDVDLEEYPDPTTAILEAAQDHGCDLLAVETHGRGDLGRLFHGSVADQLVRQATIPVLVHRSVMAKPVFDPTPEIDHAELVTVGTFKNLPMAQLAIHDLQAEGIRARLSGENQAGLSGFLDIEVMVPAWDADRARQILTKLECAAN